MSDFIHIIVHIHETHAVNVCHGYNVQRGSSVSYVHIRKHLNNLYAA